MPRTASRTASAGSHSRRSAIRHSCCRRWRKPWRSASGRTSRCTPCSPRDSAALAWSSSSTTRSTCYRRSPRTSSASSMSTGRDSCSRAASASRCRPNGSMTFHRSRPTMPSRCSSRAPAPAWPSRRRRRSRHSADGWRTSRSRSSWRRRGRAYSPLEQLLERLGQRLDLLKAGRDADPRQQTLRATIEWSYDLLDTEEQRLLRALSVFAGGCTFEAADAVCGADPDSLQSLIDKSLVRVRADDAGGTRYWMLETIREYAAERLDRLDEAGAVRSRHGEWIVQLVDGLAVPLRRLEPSAVLLDSPRARQHPSSGSVVAWRRGRLCRNPAPGQAVRLLDHDRRRHGRPCDRRAGARCPRTLGATTAGGSGGRVRAPSLHGRAPSRDRAQGGGTGASARAGRRADHRPRADESRRRDHRVSQGPRSDACDGGEHRRSRDVLGRGIGPRSLVRSAADGGPRALCEGDRRVLRRSSTRLRGSI